MKMKLSTNLMISDLFERLSSSKTKLICTFLVIFTSSINAQDMNLYNLKMTQNSHFWILETSQLFEIHDTMDNSIRSIYKVDTSFIEKIEERLIKLSELIGIPKEELDYSFESLEIIMNKCKFILSNYTSYFRINFQSDSGNREKLLSIYFYHEDIIECVLSYCGEVILRYNQDSYWDIATRCAEFKDAEIELDYYEPYIKSREDTEMRFFGLVVSDLQTYDDMSFAYWIKQEFLKKKYDDTKSDFKP